MSRSAQLGEKAYEALKAAKQNPDESLSQVILRLVPAPVRTFGDLEKHLQQSDGPILPDLSKIRRVRDGRYKSRRPRRVESWR